MICSLMKYTLILALCCLILTACSTTGGVSTKEKAEAVTGSSGKVIKISNTITFSGVKDYKMATVDGAGLYGDGSQAENQESPFYMLKGATLKNVVAKNWPESVSIRQGNAVLENIQQADVGEDAVSTYKNHPTKGVIIRNCRFAKATDKILQFNEGTGDILVEGCTFDGFGSAIRIKKGVKNVTIRNCSFKNGSGAVVLDKGVPVPKITGCTYSNVKTKLKK